MQLYTVRKQIDANAEATLKAIADLGYKEVEVLRGTLAKVGPLARGLGLSPISVHVDTPLITGQWDAWKFMRGAVPEGYGVTELIADAQAQGVKYLVLPYLMAAERGGGAPFYLQLADRLNTVGEQVKKAGLQLCYHNHGFEFEPLPDGRRPLDVLMGAVKPELVKLELDVFWVSVTGADPVALIKQYSGRIPLLHLKDKAKGTAPETQESKVAADDLHAGRRRRRGLPGGAEGRRRGRRRALLRRAGPRAGRPDRGAEAELSVLENL